MKLSDKLQVEINQVRERALELAEIEEPTDENRNEISELRTKMKDLNLRHQTAQEAEETEIREIAKDPSQEDGEGRELSALVKESRLAPFVQAAVADDFRSIDGREAELAAALEIDAANGDFPLALMVDWSGDEERQRNELLPPGMRFPSVGGEEHRVDTVTNLSISTMVTSGMWLVRMLAMSNATHIGVTTRSVGPGDHIYPYVSGGGTVSTPAKNAETDSAAATVSTKTHTPNAIHTRYLISEEDRIRLGNAYEGALRTDMRNNLVSSLDGVVFTKATDGMLAAVTVASGDAAIAASSTFAAVHSNVLEAVDGVYAMELMDLNVSVKPDGYGRMAEIHPDNTSTFLTDYLKAMGCITKANAHIPEITSADNQSYVLVSKARGITGAAILSVYQSGTMRIDRSAGILQKRQIALDLVGFYDFDVIRTDNWRRFRIRS